MVKLMNFTDNSLTHFTASFKQGLEQFRMSIAAIGQDSFLKFYEFITYRLFANKKRSYFGQNIEQCFCGDRPSRRSSFIFPWRDILYMATESFRKPRQYGEFSIANLKCYSIYIIRFILGLPFLYTETSFRINQPSKINIVSVLRRFNAFILVDLFNRFFCNKIVHMPVLSYFINKIVSLFNYIARYFFEIIGSNKSAKFTVYLCRYSFINQERLYSFGKTFGGRLFDGPTKSTFMMFFRRFFAYISSELLFKQFQYFTFNRYTLDRKLINHDHLRFLDSLSKIKTSVAIKITGSIKQYIILHKYNYTGKLFQSIQLQRLSGFDNSNNAIICDSPNPFERLGGRINKTPRLEIGH